MIQAVRWRWIGRRIKTGARRDLLEHQLKRYVRCLPLTCIGQAVHRSRARQDINGHGNFVRAGNGFDQSPHMAAIKPRCDLDNARTILCYDHLKIKDSIARAQGCHDAPHQILGNRLIRRANMNARYQVATWNPQSMGTMYQTFGENLHADLSARNKHIAGNLDAIEKSFDDSLPCA